MSYDRAALAGAKDEIVRLAGARVYAHGRSGAVRLRRSHEPLFEPPAQALTAYTPGEQPRVKLIKLNTNESPYPPSPEAVRARRRRDRALPALSDIPARISARQPPNSTASIRTGSSTPTARTKFWPSRFRPRRAGVSFPDITYGFYPVWTRLYGLRRRVIPVEKDFSIDLDAYGGRGLIVIANPNAPRHLPAAFEDRGADSVQSRLGGLIDEAYVDFGGESAIPLVEKYENLVVVQTFSKSRRWRGRGLASRWRSRTDRDLNRIKCSFNPYNVSTPPS